MWSLVLGLVVMEVIDRAAWQRLRHCWASALDKTYDASQYSTSPHIMSLKEAQCRNVKK
jgi:hypothetical protein